MISKAPARKGGKSTFAALAEYMARDAEKPPSATNCLHLAGEDLDLVVAEIKATQALNKRAKSNKTYHLLILFRDREDVPTEEILREIEEAFCEALGFCGHQRISAFHVHTEHPHVHIAINKIHPKTFRIHNPYKAYYIQDRICREMEKKYGLRVDNGVDFHDQGESRCGADNSVLESL